MNTQTEPTEIELLDLDKFGFDHDYKRAASLACQSWGSLHVFPQAPKTIADACFGARRFDESQEPDDLSVLERKLFEVNPVIMNGENSSSMMYLHTWLNTLLSDISLFLKRLA